MAHELTSTAISGALQDWTASEGPLYRRLATGLRAAIEAVRLPPGTMLPPERSLAATLAVSRSTVVAAFEDLKRTGHLEARQGSGTWVRGRARLPDEGNVELVEELEDHAIVRDITGSPSQIIELTMSAVDCAPEVTQAALSLEPALLERWSTGHGYSPQGVEELRRSVAEHLEGMGVPTTPQQVLITAGATQAVLLATRLYLEPGATAVVESPTYGGALDILHASGARLFGVDVDVDGARTDQFADLLARVAPRLAYLVPDCHNPTGVMLSHARREEIANLAAETHVPVIEDLALRDVWFGAPPPPPIASFAPDAPVLTVGTMSKVFWAGLRVGWMRGSEAAIAKLARLKVITDFGTPIHTQALTAQLLPVLEPTAAWRRAELQERLSVLRAAGALHLPDWQFNEPVGGLSVWARLPAPLAADLARRAPDHGVAVVAGFAFSAEHHLFADRIRLPFVAPPRVIREGMRRLGEAWSSLERGEAPSAAATGAA